MFGGPLMAVHQLPGIENVLGFGLRRPSLL